MKCSQINRYNEIQIIREMRSPWQLIMWKRKQFNKGQARFENRLGGGSYIAARGEQMRGGQEEGGSSDRGERERERGKTTESGCLWRLNRQVRRLFPPVWRICVYPKDGRIIRKAFMPESADSGFNTQNYFRGSESESHLLVTFLRGPLVQGKMEAVWQGKLSYGIFVFL